MKICLVRTGLIVSGLLLSMSAEAHDALTAMQQGGSLMKMAAALLHPLLESDLSENLLTAGLVLPLILIVVKASASTIADTVSRSRMRLQRVRSDRSSDIR